MKVLIAIDDSPCSAAALEQMLSRGWSEDSEIKIATVIEPFVYGSMAPTIYPEFAQSVANAERDYIDFNERLVKSQVDRLRQSMKCKVEGIVLHGAVAETIVAEAKSWKADLIVLGSHGRRGFQKFFLGSVSEKVLRLADCSVEVVKDRAAFKEREAEENTAKETAKV